MGIEGSNSNPASRQPKEQHTCLIVEIDETDRVGAKHCISLFRLLLALAVNPPSDVNL
jgi:hypothetical protein